MELAETGHRPQKRDGVVPRVTDDDPPRGESAGARSAPDSDHALETTCSVLDVRTASDSCTALVAPRTLHRASVLPAALLVACYRQKRTGHEILLSTASRAWLRRLAGV